jgi:probable rRNA maturation factor
MRGSSKKPSKGARPTTIEEPPFLELVINDSRWDAVFGLIRIEALVHAAVEATGNDSAELGIVIAFGSDTEVRALNKAFLGRDKPTNVLSFPAIGDCAASSSLSRTASGRRRRSIGDVILAFETCDQEARDTGIPLSDHACHLALHGVLHLLGFDHEDDASARDMESIESTLLTDIGIADPYANGAISGAGGHGDD